MPQGKVSFPYPSHPFPLHPIPTLHTYTHTHTHTSFFQFSLSSRQALSYPFPLSPRLFQNPVRSGTCLAHDPIGIQHSSKNTARKTHSFNQQSSKKIPGKRSFIRRKIQPAKLIHLINSSKKNSRVKIIHSSKNTAGKNSFI